MKAARGLADLVLEHNIPTVSNSYNVFTHAARALVLLENVDAELAPD